MFVSVFSVASFHLGARLNTIPVYLVAVVFVVVFSCILTEVYRFVCGCVRLRPKL